MNPFQAIRFAQTSRAIIRELTPTQRRAIWPLVALRANWAYVFHVLWLRDLLRGRWFLKILRSAFWQIIILTVGILLVNVWLTNKLVATERESELASVFVLFGFVSGVLLGVRCCSAFVCYLTKAQEFLDDSKD